MKDCAEIIDVDFDDLCCDNIEVIEIDDYEVEIIEVDDVNFSGSGKSASVPIKESLILKIRKLLSGRKVAKVVISTCTVLVTLTGVFLIDKKLESNKWLEQENVVYNEQLYNIDFSLNDLDYNTVLVNTSYEEKGASVIFDGVDRSSDVIIDSSNLNIGKVGTYHVVYTYPITLNQVKTLYRTINVVDTEAPVIKLLGSSVYTMLVGDSFVDEGVVVTDNSLEDLSNSVVVDSNVNTSRVGRYYVKYSVSDSSGNTSEIVRTVVVKSSYNYSNSVNYNSFTDSGIYFTGSVSNYFNGKFVLKNKTTGNESLVYGSSGYSFKLSIDTTGLENGIYEIYLDGIESLSSKMDDYKRIVRARTGDKLVTMDYSKGIVNMIVEDFSYQYDVVIDPGHGGADFGATNGRFIEKNINLEQSLYEKQRYEQMGLRVLLLRDSNDNYGTLMGLDSYEDVDRKGFAVGYYGTVSRIVYSNHHNSSSNSSSRGWEILVPAGASYDDLSVEHVIASEFESVYARTVNPYYRFYTKDLESATPTNKANGEVYSFDDYYAVIRIPNKNFNVKNVIFEGAYINNTSDMSYYYDSGYWKTLSEIKIKAYVESIGVEYVAP